MTGTATPGTGLLPARPARRIVPGERIHVVGAAGAGASAAVLHGAWAGGRMDGCDPGGPSPYNVWAATSADGGVTFSKPLQVSRANSPAPQVGLPFGIADDFSFITLSGTHAFVAWADYRPGDRSGFFSAVNLKAFKRNKTSG